MEKRYALCLDVLKRFQDAGILQEVILVGSWCMHFYRDYFKGVKYMPTIRTRDIDFAVPTPIRIKKRVDVAELLKDEGFLVQFSGGRGFQKLVHPELIVEFLVPEKGRGIDKPYPIPQLGTNAQALRFLDFLIENTIVIDSEGLRVRIPHPAAFGLHKLIVSGRRNDKKEKAAKDIKEGVAVLTALVEQDEAAGIREMFCKMPVPWRKKVVNALAGYEDEDIVSRLMILLTVS